MMSASLIQLMHLADSALPLGGFAFSNGLECAFKIGLIRSQQDLYAYLIGFLEQAADFDLPFIHSFYEDPLIWETVVRYDRMLTTPGMRKASIAQGNSWLRLLPSLFPDLDMTALRQDLRVHNLPSHFLIVLVRTLKESGLSLDDICSLYLFIQLRDQCSGAIRLGALGPNAAQALQAKLEQEVPILLARASNKTAAEAVRTTPLLDLAQASHPILYTKLFQN